MTPAEHYHPYQEEDFTVLQGELTVKMPGQIIILKPAEYLLETAAGLATDGRVSKKGMPSLLQVALMANKYSKVFRLSKPSFAVQKIVFIALSPFAYMAGLNADYEEYLD